MDSGQAGRRQLEWKIRPPPSPSSPQTQRSPKLLELFSLLGAADHINGLDPAGLGQL